MKQACCRRRVKRGFIGLIEIVIVAVIILGGVLLYVNMSKGAAKASRELDAVGAPTTASAPAAGGSGGSASSAGGSPTADFQRVGNTPSSLPGKAIRRARVFECESNLRQVRMLLETAKSENTEGQYPDSLQAIPEAARISLCPVDKSPYTYDAATGAVHCTHPEHEKY